MLTVAEVKARTCKERDSWWTVLLVDPIAVRLTRLVSGVRWITPNRITLTAFAIGLIAAACFTRATAGWLAVGAVLYYVGFLLDCIDGKIARLNGTGSIFGMWLDYILDHVRIITCVTALFGGQYAATKNVAYLIAGAGALVLELFHYVNSQEIFQINTEMRTRLEARRAEAGLASAVDAAEAGKRPGNRSIMQLTGNDQGLFGRVRGWLRRSRIRPHLVGGIEFQMSLLIVAPLAGAIFGGGAIIGVTVGAAALMILFELAVIFMVYRAARSVTSQIAAIRVPGQQSDALAFTGGFPPVQPRASEDEAGRART
ncbi:MAG: CDP-alcohol phosphatidyltransferase family protein [Hamadaea sp.]|uniref:CDP-alcohol phosphatidyltransferase family protein n=1 Tax=Hamadaea sp. TaxID=2024425 RepID=UPI00181CF4DC|nr:CDP-alcohol phosphatidyltransferase family protein [Hamadaea sp.]NUR74124.1 CDP-alcohol phosphatidyltransferase family protein [Hamadaea sp.]NUT20322.1 CDP-alcohol phosphatidyltransferase family protein [Hamadaea sp.]